MPIFIAAPAFTGRNFFPLLQLLQQIFHLLARLFCNQHRAIQLQRLLLAIAINFRRTAVPGQDTSAKILHRDRITGIPHHRSKTPFLLQRLLQTLDILDIVDINKGHHRTLDAVIQGFIRTQTQHIPMAVLVCHFQRLDYHGGGHLMHALLQIGDRHIGTDIADGPAHIGIDQIEQLLRCGCEASNTHVFAQNDNGQLHAGQQITQVIVGGDQLLIAYLVFFIDRRQLLVGRL